MKAKRTDMVPARLEAVRKRLDLWRSGQRRGARIPARLWRSAARLARAYGLGRTARVLRLDCYTLKKHIENELSVGARDEKAEGLRSPGRASHRKSL